MLTTVSAQVEQPGNVGQMVSQSVGQKPGQTGSVVTASASAERVRFTAPSNVVRMQVQIISESGQIVFEVSSKGNVLDWSLQDSNGQRLQGSYLTVVTVKSLSGRLSEKIGSVSVTEKQVELTALEATGLTAAQQQTVGPIEEQAALTVLKADEQPAATVLANNGSDGQIIRDRGALSFRIGDFYSGKDTEQMRLTEAGNLGIGTDNPQAKLEVAGTIRTTDGIEFADGTVQTTGLNGRKDKDGNLVPNVGGTGTQNKLAKWTDNSGTLGDSLLSEAGGNVVNNGTNIQMTAPASSSVDTNLIFVDANSRTTGMIASATPAYTAGNGPYFAMRGNTYAALPGQRGLFSMSAGNVTSPTGNDGTMVFLTGADQLRMVIKPNGNVGVGTSSPGSKLDVAGDINTSTQYNIGGSRILSAPGVNNAFVGVGAGNINSTGQQNSLFGTSAGSLNMTGNRNSLFGSQAGMVMTTGANSFFGYRAGFQNSTGGFNSFFGDSSGTQNVDGSNNTAIGSSTKLGSSNLTNATAIGAQAQVDANNSLILGSIAGVNGSTASTNVGIGTTSPSAKLEVSDNTSATLYSTTFSGINGFIGRSARGTSSSPSATLAGDTLSFFGGRGFASSPDQFVGSSAAIIIKATENFTSGSQGSSIILETSTTGTSASERREHMRIDQNGNVGIGTATPALKLEVRDTFGIGGHVQIGAPIAGTEEKLIVFGDSGCGGPCVYIGEQDSDDRMVLRASSFQFKFGNVEPFANNTQALGSSANKWTEVWAVNGTIQTSDVRLKRGITNLKYGLSQVMQLRPVSFQWKEGNDNRTHLGLIAQEVDAVMPEAVEKSADANAPLGMNYSALIPVLIKAIQEQQQTLEHAQAELKAVQAKNEGLSRRMISLEANSTVAKSTKKAH